MDEYISLLLMVMLSMAISYLSPITNSIGVVVKVYMYLSVSSERMLLMPWQDLVFMRIVAPPKMFAKLGLMIIGLFSFSEVF
jgi:hypothetical protein